MNKKYRFKPTKAMKRFLNPELAARDGEINDIWDQELIDLFPCAFEEIKQPMTLDGWIEKKYLNKEYLPRFWSDFKLNLKECHEWTAENERLKHEPKQSFEEWWDPEERCPYGECKVYHLECDQCKGFAKIGWDGYAENRGYDE